MVRKITRKITKVKLFKFKRTAKAFAAIKRARGIKAKVRESNIFTEETVRGKTVLRPSKNRFSVEFKEKVTRRVRRKK